MSKRKFHYVTKESYPHVACGEKGELDYTGAWEFVTCLRCKRTKAYREAVEKEEKK